MMSTLNKPTYSLIALLGFLCICAWAWPYKEPGYSQREIDRVGEIALGEVDGVRQSLGVKHEAMGSHVTDKGNNLASPAIMTSQQAAQVVNLWGDEGEIK